MFELDQKTVHTSMEKTVLQKIKIHYSKKHMHDFKKLEFEMDNDFQLVRWMIWEYWNDYFEKRTLYT